MFRSIQFHQEGCFRVRDIGFLIDPKQAAITRFSFRLSRRVPNWIPVWLQQIKREAHQDADYNQNSAAAAWLGGKRSQQVIQGIERLLREEI